jgi:hypothetical protein
VIKQLIIGGLLLALGTGLAGAAESDVALFGSDPGTGKAHACFTRTYTDAHIKAHPQQNVTAMTLLVDSDFDNESDMGRTYTLGLGVNFRRVDTLFQASGGCSSVDGVLNCGIDCDGGAIDVKVKDANSVLVSIPYGARTWDAESEEEPPENARFGSDDKLFRLDRADMKTCLPLIYDEELKAEVAAGK